MGDEVLYKFLCNPLLIVKWFTTVNSWQVFFCSPKHTAMPLVAEGVLLAFFDVGIFLAVVILVLAALFIFYETRHSTFQLMHESFPMIFIPINDSITRNEQYIKLCDEEAKKEESVQNPDNTPSKYYASKLIICCLCCCRKTADEKLDTSTEHKLILLLTNSCSFSVSFAGFVLVTFSTFLLPIDVAFRNMNAQIFPLDIIFQVCAKINLLITNFFSHMIGILHWYFSGSLGICSICVRLLNF